MKGAAYYHRPEGYFRGILFIAAGIIILFTAVLFFAVLLPSFAGQDRRAEEQRDELAYTSYVVQEGDSLWSIADEHMSVSFDSHNTYIEEVMRVNHMQTAQIYPGDLIAIPAGEEDSGSTLASAGRLQ